ncbi:MAG: PAS domain-containing protein [Thermogemmatispora sp.]|uniref:ATP-binding protein n=1 Tax=Thermogemmatispora sp. TaxID=1968838 RepID=UPI0019E959EB|nr:ATP-binding protein [Thermogemmatispora sp.]MBE3565411.1 PAS domain-containing protein [Thermogemmatispora sp.]
MRPTVRRSLLTRLLTVYLLFVLVVLLGGVGINTLVEQRLRSDVQAADQALAEEIARETSLQLLGAEQALQSLGRLVVESQSETPATLERLFEAWHDARSDVDHVYWLDPFGAVLVAWPAGHVTAGAEFSPPTVVEQALKSSQPAFEVGIVGLAPSRLATPGVIVAQAVRSQGHLRGLIAASFSLAELSLPLVNVVQAQQRQSKHLMITVIDGDGVVVAASERGRLLETALSELPGAALALQGQSLSRAGPGPDGQDWLFSSVPVPKVGWAVVVERPAREALAVVDQFHLWLLLVALLFTLGGLFFWLLLHLRVIRPLQALAGQHQALPASADAIPTATLLLARQRDEIGDLARSLIRLERDGLRKLSELHTLLETSNAVVRSLDPRAVIEEIMHEVQRLVDVQAVAVLLPDEQGVLRVLQSSGHSERYDRLLSLSPARVSSAAVLALRSGQPVQKLLDGSQPSFAYDDGFRAVLALPIISHHVGSVVLVVHRREPRLFEEHEVQLLSTFANYATLAWEHAVLYERSDERLREVAQENARLYRRATEEKQRLAAIMESMQDGLLLLGTDNQILYANQAACTIAGLPRTALEGKPIAAFYEALQATGAEAAACAQALNQTEPATFLLENGEGRQARTLQLRLFAVQSETGETIGRGLLVRDVTRERELDEFKTTLLAAVGHEVRTPLAAIKGYASTLLQPDVLWSPEEQQQFLQTILQEADRLTQLVRNLLDLSRQEAGLLQLRCTPVDPRALVLAVGERIKSGRATLTVEIPAGLPPVLVDRGRIEIVLHNLISNALLYGARQVQVKAWRSPDEEETLIFAVLDDGPGIAPEELPHIFERFYRASRGRRQHAGGTGLGLAICKAFVEAHGGRIWAQSSPQGTAMCFSLPCSSQSALTTLREGVEEEGGSSDGCRNREGQAYSAC